MAAVTAAVAAQAGLAAVALVLVLALAARCCWGAASPSTTLPPPSPCSGATRRRPAHAAAVARAAAVQVEEEGSSWRTAAAAAAAGSWWWRGSRRRAGPLAALLLQPPVLLSAMQAVAAAVAGRRSTAAALEACCPAAGAGRPLLKAVRLPALSQYRCRRPAVAAPSQVPLPAALAVALALVRGACPSVRSWLASAASSQTPAAVPQVQAHLAALLAPRHGRRRPLEPAAAASAAPTPWPAAGEAAAQLSRGVAPCLCAAAVCRLLPPYLFVSCRCRCCCRRVIVTLLRVLPRLVRESCFRPCPVLY